MLGPGASAGGAGGPSNSGDGAGAWWCFLLFFLLFPFLLGAGAGTSAAGGEASGADGAGGELAGAVTGAGDEGSGELTGAAFGAVTGAGEDEAGASTGAVDFTGAAAGDFDVDGAFAGGEEAGEAAGATSGAGVALVDFEGDSAGGEEAGALEGDAAGDCAATEAARRKSNARANADLRAIFCCRREESAVIERVVHSQSPRPSVVFQSKDENSGNQLQKLRNQFSRVFKGFSHPTETKRITYNPEVLTSQKRQWARFQLQSLDQKSFKEPTRLFESIAVVGLHPNCDNQALQKLLFARKSEGSGKIRSALSGHFNSRVEPYLEPQVLFVYPPEKQLPLKHKDLLSFCFPGGIEVHAVEKTPSMSELNEILLGQEHLKQSDLSFVFRLQVADSSTLYGCCVLVEEIVQKPSRLVSMMSHNQPLNAPLSRHVITTQRCYCLLSRLPFFELHFGVLNSIFTEERFERLTQSICGLDMGISEMDTKLSEEDIRRRISFEDEAEDGLHEAVRNTALCDISSDELADGESCVTNADTEENSHSYNGKPIDSPASVVCNSDIIQHEEESPVSLQNSEVDGICINHCEATKKMFEKSIPDAVWPLLRYQYESSESSSSLQGSPCEGRQFRSEIEDAETEETSSSGRDDSVDHDDILEWAKANNLGSLQIICEYFRLSTPARGSTLEFHLLEHLQPLEFKRPDGGALNIDGQLIDLRSCSTSLEMAEVYNEILAEEEATALSVWAISCLCGFLRLENVLTLFAGALLEKQVVVVCSNLGVLSALVLSIVPLIRPYRWQSLLMPVLPNDMLDFLDAPVPYIVGVKSKTSEVQSKTNAILVDLNKNQVRSPSMPQLPRQKELLASLSPYHSKLVGESYLGKRRPFYDCTDVQAEAAKGFLAVLREYLDSLCSNLRSHTITNVQSNDDKVSLLLKDSFIGSFTNRDRPFMKLFVDTQLFSVHTDLALSFYQKD